MVAVARAANPRVTVLLAQIIPVDQLRAATRIRALNGEIVKLGERLHQDRSPVVVVDQHSGFDASIDTYDGVHPNAAGEDKMARRWLAALLEEHGALPPRQVVTMAAKAGYSRATVYRARQILGERVVDTVRRGRQDNQWALADTS